MNARSMVLPSVVAGVAFVFTAQAGENDKKSARSEFMPKPLDDDWSKWLVGQWEGSGKSETGGGKAQGSGEATVEMALNGQFRIHRSEAIITEITPEQRQYFKKRRHATDEEIDRFMNEPFRALEIYSLDLRTGEVVGFMFDSLRCMATGRGKLEGNTETVQWTWARGQKSTRVTKKLGPDKVSVTERIVMPDGSIMEDTGEATRVKEPRIEK